jgi:hypothetical protein
MTFIGVIARVYVLAFISDVVAALSLVLRTLM